MATPFNMQLVAEISLSLYAEGKLIAGPELIDISMKIGDQALTRDGGPEKVSEHLAAELTVAIMRKLQGMAELEAVEDIAEKSRLSLIERHGR